MRAYETLTERGRLGRLRDLALQASARYDLDVRRCVRSARSFNTIFRVDAAGGERFALRVGSHLRIHPEDTEDVETAWMARLRRDGIVPVPFVVDTPKGSRFIDVEHPGVLECRRCILFGWIAGRRVGERLDGSIARRLGEMSAILHDEPTIYVPSTRLDAAVADRVLYWTLGLLLDELAPTYGSLLTDALDRAQEAVDRLWSRPLISGGRLEVIDFQDLFWGFEQQDLAITTAWFRSSDEPAPLLAAFREGYRTIRPWPEMSTEDLGALVAGRWLNQLNIGLHVRNPGLDEFVARGAVRLRAWMDAG
ncbi:MAG: hypothetical protein E6F95_12825 [Actinobacteria bacterium]|nr:MAG: hypothetical protein E6F95_12825 [Actinomycetota bacterium]